MKNPVLLILTMAVILLSQSVDAQSRKEKRKAKKQKNKVEQVDPASEKQNNNDSKPDNVIKPVTTNAQPDGKTPGTENATGNTGRKPTTSTQDKKPDKNNLDLNNIISNSRPIITEKPNGSVNWTEQYIEAKGQSVIDEIKFPNPAQAKLMATRGAIVVAQRNLLEMINGVNVTSETKVKDMMTQGDYIYTRVDGVIKGAEMVGEAIEKDGIVEVKMRVPMYQTNGLAAALYDNIPQNKNLQISQATQEQLAQEVQDQLLNGLAFNLNGKTFDPSLFPVIVDENNNLVFDFSKIYDPTSGKFPKIFGATETLFKEFGYDKGIEYLDILRTEPGKIVLDNKNIKKVNWQKIAKTAGTIGKFLMMFI